MTGLKNGVLWWHSMRTISPQSPGFRAKDEEVNRERTGVTGTEPVRLLWETLKLANVV